MLMGGCLASNLPSCGGGGVMVDVNSATCRSVEQVPAGSPFGLGAGNQRLSRNHFVDVRCGRRAADRVRAGPACASRRRDQRPMGPTKLHAHAAVRATRDQAGRQGLPQWRHVVALGRAADRCRGRAAWASRPLHLPAW